MKEVKNTLSSTLDTEQKRLVYHLSDGTKGTVEIAELAKIRSNKTVSDMWHKWSMLGLGENLSVRGGSRFKYSFDLEDFGIEVPHAKKAEKEEDQATHPTPAARTEVSEQSP